MSSRVAAEDPARKLQAALQQETLMRIDRIVAQIELAFQIDVRNDDLAEGRVDLPAIGKREVGPAGCSDAPRES